MHCWFGLQRRGRRPSKPSSTSSSASTRYSHFGTKWGVFLVVRVESGLFRRRASKFLTVALRQLCAISDRKESGLASLSVWNRLELRFGIDLELLPRAGSGGIQHRRAPPLQSVCVVSWFLSIFNACSYRDIFSLDPLFG